MQAKQVPHEYSSVMYWGDILTSMYLPLLISYLYYNNLFLLIGKVASIPIISVLAALEILKYVFYTNSQKAVIHKHVKDVVKIILTIILFFLTLYIITVLFGAAVFSNFEETGMFVLLLTTLIALPVCIHLGAETAIIMFLSVPSFEGNQIQNLFMLKTRITLFGAWLGAIVIPLDWNRPWQNWPIPCCLGAVCGYTVANWLTSLLQFRRRIKSTKKTGKYAL